MDLVKWTKERELPNKAKSLQDVCSTRRVDGGCRSLAKSCMGSVQYRAEQCVDIDAVPVLPRLPNMNGDVAVDRQEEQKDSGRHR